MTIRAALKGFIVAALRVTTAIMMLMESCILLIVAATAPLIARRRGRKEMQNFNASGKLLHSSVVTEETMLTGHIEPGHYKVASDKMSRLVVGLVGLGFKTPAVKRFADDLNQEHVAATSLSDLIREGLQALSSTN